MDPAMLALLAGSELPPPEPEPEPETETEPEQSAPEQSEPELQGPEQSEPARPKQEPEPEPEPQTDTPSTSPSLATVHTAPGSAPTAAAKDPPPQPAKQETQRSTTESHPTPKAASSAPSAGRAVRVAAEALAWVSSPHRGPDAREVAREAAEMRAKAEAEAALKKGKGVVRTETLERLAVPPKHWATSTGRAPKPREPLPWSGAKVGRMSEETARRLTQLPAHRRPVSKAADRRLPQQQQRRHQPNGGSDAQKGANQRSGMGKLKPEVEARLMAVPAHKSGRPPKPELSVFASREDLLVMKLSELRRYALELGLGEEQCEDALDSDAPKQAMVNQLQSWIDAIRFAEEEALRVWQEEEQRILRQQEAERRAREKSTRSPTTSSRSPSRPALRLDSCFSLQTSDDRQPLTFWMSFYVSGCWLFALLDRPMLLVVGPTGRCRTRSCCGCGRRSRSCAHSRLPSCNRSSSSGSSSSSSH